MRYHYAYKTSDGVRHEAEMSAASRVEVFETLRAQGIRAIKVVAADGSKANGEIRGVRRRVLALSVSAAFLIAIFGTVVAYRFAGKEGGAAAVDYAEAQPRHWIAREVRADFDRSSERVLALFARPGALVDEREIPPVDAALEADFRAALACGVTIRPGEDARVAELKRVVLGLKREAAVYLKGGADLETLIRYFVQRQRMEAGLRAKILADLEVHSGSERAKRLKAAEELLSTMGLEPLKEQKR